MARQHISIQERMRKQIKVIKFDLSGLEVAMQKNGTFEAAGKIRGISNAS
jgi:hypothetical protein